MTKGRPQGIFSGGHSRRTSTEKNVYMLCHDYALLHVLQCKEKNSIFAHSNVSIGSLRRRLTLCYNLLYILTTLILKDYSVTRNMDSM